MYGQFRGQKFYHKTVGYGRNQASIFCIKQFLAKIVDKPQLFIDGTFKVVPKFCSQLIVIMCDLNGNNLVSVSTIFINVRFSMTNCYFTSGFSHSLHIGKIQILYTL